MQNVPILQQLQNRIVQRPPSIISVNMKQLSSTPTLTKAPSLFGEDSQISNNIHAKKLNFGSLVNEQALGFKKDTSTTSLGALGLSVQNDMSPQVVKSLTATGEEPIKFSTAKFTAEQLGVSPHSASIDESEDLKTCRQMRQKLI